MKTDIDIKAVLRRNFPGFAAGLALGAIGAAICTRSGPGPEPPPGGGEGPGPAPAATNSPARRPMTEAEILAALAGETTPASGPPELSWHVELGATADDRFPIFAVYANRPVFGREATNGVPSISLLREGEPIRYSAEFKSDDEIDIVDWILLEPTEPADPGEFEIWISKDFPDPAGNPAKEDFSAKKTFAPEPVTIAHVESFADDFSRSAGARIWLSGVPDGKGDPFSGNLRFEPEVAGLSVRRREGWSPWYEEGRGHYDDACFEAKGDFIPGKRYRVRIGKRWIFDAEDKATFASTNAVSFTAKSAGPAMEWLDPGTFLGGSDPELAIRACLVPRARVRARRVVPKTLVHAIAHRDDWRFDDDEWFEKPMERIVEELAPGGIATNALRLADFVSDSGAAPEGYWFVEIQGLASTNEPPDAAMPGVSRYVSLSDTAITVRLLAESAAVWTTGISTGEPVPGAAVSLLAQNGEEIARGETGPDGFALLQRPKDSPRPVLALAQKPGGSYAYLELDGSNRSDGELPLAADPFPESDSKLDGWVTSDRGIYRHGERVRIEALVRDATGAAPEPRPLALEIVRGDGIAVKRWTIVSDARGRVSPPGGFFEIPDSQPSGTWRAVLRMPEKNGDELGSRAFRVESFVPPKIRVDFAEIPGAVAPEPDSGRKVSFPAKIASRYLFGSPAAGLKYEVSARASAAPFAPEGWDEGWTFGRLRGGTGTLRPAASGELGPDGAAAVSVPLPAWTGRNAPAAALELRVEATVFEPGGRPVTTAKTVPYHVYPFYVGLKAPDGAEPGRETALPFRFALPGGDPAPDAAKAVKAELFSVSEDWLWEKASGGEGWRWHRNRVEKKIADGVFPAEGGSGEVRFALPQGDSAYLVRVEPDGDWPGTAAMKPCSELEFSTDGAPAAPKEGPHRLSIATDKKSYRPGDVARIEISSPFDGLALVTFQQRSVLSHRLVSVTNGEAAVEWPVEAGHAPSVDVAASLVRPASASGEWAEHRAYGSVRIPVENPSARLSPALSPPEAEPLPGGGWRVVAEAALANSPEAAGAHATFFLVDEAVLGLTNEKEPDPAGRFGRPRRSGADLFDSFRRLLRIRDLPLLATAATGGDDDASGAGSAEGGRRLQAAKTRRFKPLAFAVHDVPFENGVARAEFELPEFAGEARVVAVAWSRSAAGAASAKCALAPALVLDADAPRFLAPGDVSEFTLSLHSTAGEPATAAWSVRAAAVVSTNGSVALGPKASATVRIPVRIREDAPEGEIAAVFRVEGLGESHSETLLLPVRPALPVATVEESVALMPGESAAFGAVTGLVSATHAELSADSDPFAAFAPALRWLSGYPWRCLEQTTSRAFPLLACGGEALALAPDAFADPAGALEGAVARTATMLRGASFTMWPDSASEIPRYGARAGLFLAEAEAAGYAVSPAVSANLRHALHRYVRMEAPDRDWRDDAKTGLAKERAFSPARTTALLGLRAAGEPDPDYEDALLDRRSRLAPEARAQLALCLLRGGRRDEALELLREEEPDSTVESLAWALVAWTETDLPETASRIESLRTRLLDARDGEHWGTTERNCAALLAAAAATRRFGRAGSAPDVLATAGGALPVAVTNSARAAEIAPAAGAGRVEVRNGGSSAVLVRRVVEGAPDPAAFSAATNGIAVSRKYFAAEFDEASGKTVRREIDPASGAVKRGAALEVELSVEPVPDSRTVLEEVVVDELLPAGLEPGPAATGGTMPVVHREIRDDRIVVFALPFSGRRTFTYEVQAVSAGDFALPPVQAAEMYRPSRNGRTAPGRLVVGE